MDQVRRKSSFFLCHMALVALVSILGTSEASAAAASTPARQAETMDELYEKAKKEGGQLTLYIALSARSEEIILPLFKKRFPVIQVNHIDATSDKLVARVVAEQRGGRIIGDVFGGTPGYLAQMTEQKLLAPLALPEAAPYPAMLKGAEWVATDTQYYIPDGTRALSRKAMNRSNLKTSPIRSGKAKSLPSRGIFSC